MLDGLTEVRIGRGTSGGWRRAGGVLALTIVDGWASETHAVLSRPAGRWQIEDRGAKNGVVINGVKTAKALLVGGDVVEIGRTFLRFEGEVEVSPDDVLDGGPDEPLAGLPTVTRWFARELERLATIARGATTVMLTGPTGAGKELVARAIHARSERAGAFVAVNCGAIPKDLVEATLFGHRRGAFSGAVDDQAGVVRAADGGTLLLDEIADLPLPAQAALLRVLQEREVTAVGATRPVAVDVRIVAATHRDLAQAVRDGAFRADLFHRLHGFAFALPALADRIDDLGLLVARFLPAGATLYPRAARALLGHAWPGNVRELAQLIGAAAALAGDGPIELEHLPDTVTTAAPVADDQRDALVRLLEEHRGNVRAIARALEKDPVQVRRWLRRYGLDAAQFR